MYYEVKKPWLNKKQIEEIKKTLKKEGWKTSGGNWETYMPSVHVYDYAFGEELVYFGNGGYRRFIQDKYNENPTKKRKITAKKFVFDRLTK
jgi:hypothetical protein